MVAIDKIIQGYKEFYHKFFEEDNELYKNLVENGQFPKTLMIACSDSRVDPSIITNAAPGEIFVIRNVANLVPPYQEDKTTYHGTSAALEFAVNILKVENIIILGHSNCSGIRTLAELEESGQDNNLTFVNEWVQIGKKAWNKVKKDYPYSDKETKISACEKESLITSLENLMSYSWIRSRNMEGTLEILVWHFDLKTGKISSFDRESREFYKIIA